MVDDDIWTCINSDSKDINARTNQILKVPEAENTVEPRRGFGDRYTCFNTRVLINQLNSLANSKWTRVLVYIVISKPFYTHYSQVIAILVLFCLHVLAN